MGRLLFPAGVAVLLASCCLYCSAQVFSTPTLRTGAAQPGQPQILQPLRPTSTQIMPGYSGMGNPWGGMPGMSGNVQGGMTANTGRMATMGRGFPRLNMPAQPGNAAGSPFGPGSQQAGAVSIMQRGRFLRENRQPGAFVGTDAREAADFVGAEEADGAGAGASTATSAAGRPLFSPGSPLSRLQGSPPIAGGPPGAGLAAPRPTMYEPRLRVDFAYPLPVPQQVQTSLVERLESCTELRRASPIEVLLEGRTATLRGTVASERDRTLAQQLILFEPGISQVRNELAVVPQPPSAPEGPAER